MFCANVWPSVAAVVTRPSLLAVQLLKIAVAVLAQQRRPIASLRSLVRRLAPSSNRVDRQLDWTRFAPSRGPIWLRFPRQSLIKYRYFVKSQVQT